MNTLSSCLGHGKGGVSCIECTSTYSCTDNPVSLQEDIQRNTPRYNKRVSRLQMYGIPNRKAWAYSRDGWEKKFPGIRLQDQEISDFAYADWLITLIDWYWYADFANLRSNSNFDDVRVESSQFLIAGTMLDQKYFSLQTAICHIAAKFQNPGVSSSLENITLMWHHASGDQSLNFSSHPYY